MMMIFFIFKKAATLSGMLILIQKSWLQFKNQQPVLEVYTVYTRDRFPCVTFH